MDASGGEQQGRRCDGRSSACRTELEGRCNVYTCKMLRQCQAGPNDVQTGDLFRTGIVDVGESGGTIVDDVASSMQFRKDLAQIKKGHCNCLGTKRRRAKPHKREVDDMSETELDSLTEHRHGASENGQAIVRRRPKRAAACSNFREKAFDLSEEDSPVKVKETWIEEEIEAVRLTQTGSEDNKPRRKIMDFSLHDGNGNLQPFEMSRSNGITITALVTPLDDDMEKNKKKGIRCERFGPIKDWEISGYKEGKNNDEALSTLPVIIALRNECKSRISKLPAMLSNGTLTIRDEQCKEVTASEDEDVKLARLVQEAEEWKMAKKQRSKRGTSQKYVYIKISEAEIANDYPLPAYYKPYTPETDEHIIFDDEVDMSANDLPVKILNWALYNSDSRLVSLELIPMKPGAENDIVIFGSGSMREDDDSFCSTAEATQLSSYS
ncbi:hypothetical protein ACQ4PT_004594 [Festuca glaucescens]